MDPIQTVKPKDSKTLMVTFSPKTGATHYIIRVQNDNGFFREDSVSSSPAEIKSLTPYTEYTLSIMAVNSGGRSQPSLPMTAKTGTVFVSVCCEKGIHGLVFRSSVKHSWTTGCFSHHCSVPTEVTWSTSLCRRDTKYFETKYAPSILSQIQFHWLGKCRFVLPINAPGHPEGLDCIVSNSTRQLYVRNNEMTPSWKHSMLSPSLPPSPGGKSNPCEPRNETCDTYFSRS